MMTKKNIIFAMLGFSIFGIGLDYYNILDYKIADALSNLSLSLLVVSFLLLFVREEIFSAWLTLAKWWIPLTFVLIIISPSGGGAFFPAFFSKELTSIWMGSLFVLFTLIIIARKYFTLRGKVAG